MPYIGILGGTFDPIHFGHLAAAQSALERLGLDRVVFVPNRQPPHKSGRRVTESHHRAAMVALAIRDNPRFVLDELELYRTGPSYSVDTIQALQAANPASQFAFLVGMDSLLQIHLWYQYETLLAITDLVVVTRPGYATAEGDAAMAGLGPELSRRIRFLETPGVAVSGTELRRMAAAGQSLRYLVPDAVAAYIGTNNLYG